MLRTMVSNDVDFGHWVRERRKARGWTQERLADELSASGWAVSRNWIVQVEKGSKPSGDFVDAVENLLGRYTPPRAEAAPVDQPDVAAAIREQTQAMVAEQREMRTMLREMIEGLAGRVSEDSVELKAGQAYLVRLVGALGVELGVPPERVLAAGGDVPAGSETVNSNAGQ